MISSLYIHIPFCKRKCFYCDFLSIAYDKRIAKEYVAAVCREIAKLNKDFFSVYIGGGTPSVLDLGLLKDLLGAFNGIVHNTAEFTVEVNPESATLKKLKILKSSGVNRISIGVQSFNNVILKKLGRIHTGQKAAKAVRLAKECGFTNIGIDLIFGSCGQDLSEWKKDLMHALALPITHISAYALSYEENTPLKRSILKGEFIPQDENSIAELYDFTLSYLPENGFEHYEVSNFAKDGFQSQHNLNYWQNNEYLGLGPGAASYQKGQRYKNTPDLKAYIEELQTQAIRKLDLEQLSRVESARETAALKIRTTDGIDFTWFKEKTGFDFMDLEKGAIATLLKQGLVRKTNRQVRLTRKGFLFCDTVSSALL